MLKGKEPKTSYLKAAVLLFIYLFITFDVLSLHTPHLKNHGHYRPSIFIRQIMLES